MKTKSNLKKQSGLFSFLGDYRSKLAILCFLVFVSSSLSLMIPSIIAAALDDFTQGKFVFLNFSLLFAAITLLIFLISVGQNTLSAYLSEKIAFDLRQKIVQNIAHQSLSFINMINPSTIFTNITSDVDAVKGVVAQAIPILFSSVLLITGSTMILFTMNWQLALGVAGIIAVLMLMFKVIFRKSGQLFKKVQESLDQLNKVINESILASALIRVVNSQYEEIKKFDQAASETQKVNLKILAFFAALIPLINFLANTAVLMVVYFGGEKVITGSLSIGTFTAFFNYISILILPVVMIGFISNMVVRASTSYQRILKILHAPIRPGTGKTTQDFRKFIEFKNVSLVVNEKYLLKNISFTLQIGKKTALIGPTGAGKTLLLYLLSGLLNPTGGEILIDNNPLSSFDQNFLRNHIAVVFQDSIIFNDSIRENISFGQQIPEQKIKKAIQTSALEDFIKKLSHGLDHMITERGSSLSGGQKQRISLARALVLEPQLLLLDDFTSRVDIHTEKVIFAHLQKNYPDLTLLAVSQKISSVKDFDHLILLMEGELLAEGKHEELLEKCFEYRQIFSSQQTT